MQKYIINISISGIDKSSNRCYSSHGMYPFQEVNIMKLVREGSRLDSFMTRQLSGPVFTWRQIIDLMIPGVLDNLSIMFIVMLITALISSNGETSVAAVALVSPITGLISCMFNGIAAGGSVVVAQSMGRGDPREIQRSIGNALVFTFGVGIVICLPFLSAPFGILHLLYPSAEPEVMAKAMTFLSGSIWSLFSFSLFQACFNILRGLGESKRCLVLSIIINVAYLLLSALFLNVLNMDIRGSVWALFLARSIGAACAVITLFFLHPPVKPIAKEMFVYDRKLSGGILRVGIPLAFEQICLSLGNIVAEMYMILLGTAALATHAIANSIMGLIFAPTMSAANLAVTVVGRCIGAGEKDEAYRYGKACTNIGMILMGIACLIGYPLLPILLKQHNPSPEVAVMATRLLYWSLFGLMIFFPKSSTLPAVLRAGSDTMYPTIVSMIVLWVFTIAMGYLLAIPMGLGLNGTWIAMWTAWAVRSTAFSFRFRSKKWLNMAAGKVDSKA